MSAPASEVLRGLVYGRPPRPLASLPPSKEGKKHRRRAGTTRRSWLLPPARPHGSVSHGSEHPDPTKGLPLTKDTVSEGPIGEKVSHARSRAVEAWGGQNRRDDNPRPLPKEREGGGMMKGRPPRRGLPDRLGPGRLRLATCPFL